MTQSEPSRSPAARRLIVTADDFGVSDAVNEAVVRAHQHGILTSASLMAGGPAFEGAVRIARANPDLSVGVHLVLVAGTAVLPHSELPSITAADGRFPDHPTRAGLRCFFSRGARAELRRELRAQIERVLAAGITPSHLDGHLHFHLHPVVFDTAVSLAREFGIRRMRVPEDDLGVALAFDRTRALRSRASSCLFQWFVRRMKRRLAREGIAAADRVFGHLRSGRIDEPYALHVLDHLVPGTHEFYFHPALGPSATPQQARETAVLSSLSLRARLESLSIRLIGAREA